MSFLEIQTRTGWGRTLGSFAVWCDPPPGALILDVGSGPGLLPAIFSNQGCRAVGIDLDFETLAHGHRHFDPSPQLVQSRAEFLPFLAGSFDLVTACNLLFLVPNPTAALREMKRAVRPGCQVCLLNPSEKMSVTMVQEVAEKRGLQGLERESLLGWLQKPKRTGAGMKLLCGNCLMGQG